MAEGSLEKPERLPLHWKVPSFYDEDDLMQELERVYDICHGCRRCFNLCNAFPVLFDAVDESPSMELDTVPKSVYWEVVDHCYLCDMCFMSKCPYVPPHEWNIDFPHLMLRAKAVKHKNGKTSMRDKLLSSTDFVGGLMSKMGLSFFANIANSFSVTRLLLEKTIGVHRGAKLPQYHGKTLSKRHPDLTRQDKNLSSDKPKVVLFTTCYVNYNEPEIGDDLVAILKHNDIEVAVVQAQCCGMPKLELGDLQAVAAAKDENVRQFLPWVEAGWHILAPIPSCVLMFKQELPLMFPDDESVSKIQQSIFDPFEYLLNLQKLGKLNTEFKNKLGKISYHVPCHLRVQNMGYKTRDMFNLIPDTEVQLIERCSGHDGTYAVKVEFHKTAMKIAKPVVKQVEKAESDYYTSDCPMAGRHIQNGLSSKKEPLHPISLIRKAYGI